MIYLIGPLLFVLFLVLPVATGYAIVQPLHRRSLQNKDAIRRYTMLDFFALAIQLQLLLAGWVAATRSSYYLGSQYHIAALLLLGLLAMWWAGVEVAVRAKATDTARRLAIHVVLLPGTAAMMVLSDFALVTVVAEIAWRFDAQLRTPNHPGIPAVITMVGGTLLGVLCLRALAWWIARASVDTSAASVPADDELV